MTAKKLSQFKSIQAELSKEINFLKNIFSVLSIPIQNKGSSEDNAYYEMVNGTPDSEEKELPKRACNITELEGRLEKMKSLKSTIKNKLAKKSLNSKINKKIKKRERLNKTNVKLPPAEKKEAMNEKHQLNVAKPVFNNDGKLVFSKFDFANVGRKDKTHKVEKDPKKILENLKQQENKFRQLEENEDGAKVKELKEKLAWKNILQKAEGQKVKDDPTLLKKSIKKMEQKKKQSKKQWENRVSNVQQKKEERQKKRKENIAKKKKEKKTKVVKAAVKRGRVVI